MIDYGFDGVDDVLDSDMLARLHPPGATQEDEDRAFEQEMRSLIEEFSRLGVLPEKERDELLAMLPS